MWGMVCDPMEAQASSDMEDATASERAAAQGRGQGEGEAAAAPLDPPDAGTPQVSTRLRSRSTMAPRITQRMTSTSLGGKARAKSRTTAAHMAKRFPRERKRREEAAAGTAAAPKDMGGDAGSGLAAEPQEDDAGPPSQSIGGLRRSTRQRRNSAYMGLDSDSDAEDRPISRRRMRLSRTISYHSVKHKKLLRRRGSQGKKASQVSSIPLRDGLRPRTGRPVRQEYSQEYEEEEEEEDDESEDESSSDADDEEAGDDAEEEEEEEGEQQHKPLKAGRGEEHGRGQQGRKQQARDEEEEAEEREGEDGEEEEEEDDEEAEEGDGRRRYALRSRTGVQRFSPRKDERPSRARSPRKFYDSGAGTKRGRDGRPRSYKRQRADDSDDSLLVDEMDPGGSWARAGRSSGHPFIPPGGLGDIGAPASWSLNNAGVGWGNTSTGDYWSSIASASGAQTAGQTSKGGADIQPVRVDESVTFDQIGGLSKYINSLKEMVFFPLMYPQFFANYHINPPRGVLLCGPPGTGKTLVARALAAAASRAGKKVSFFMRKGADVLSKWVGETERQLKMLFEEAQRCQPSIIFFDEIDGLAPVRSSKQEQIHNSIVSTLLALMDGLDSRGQVVVIGATNRVDAVDSALRRPGRFDREFFFPLPDAKAREAILDIHTRNWTSPPPEELRAELAASCVGYCGADLKALCTEAAIRAFRKKYPQIYQCDELFILDVDSVEVGKRHFVEAMSSITPASHRGAIVHARPLPTTVASCLRRQVDAIMARLHVIFLPDNMEAVSSDDEDEEGEANNCVGFPGLSFSFVHRPRFLVCGEDGTGLDYIGPGILHELERYPVHSLSLPSLLSDPGAKSPEEALVHVFQEARRNTPSVLYLPHLELWWETAHDQLRAVLLMLLSEVPPDLPILLLGTSSVPPNELDKEALTMFGRNVHELGLPSEEDRRRFFRHMVDTAVALSDQRRKKKGKQKAPLPLLPKAPVVEKGPSEAELLVRAELEEHAIRRLRMSLRDVCNRLLYEKRFSIFHYPVTEREAPDYRSVVETPMDVATLLQRVDSGHYRTREAFFQDVELIPANAKAYNGDDYTTNRISSKACALRDAVHGMLSQLDPSVVAQCDAIAAQGVPTERPDLLVPTLPNSVEPAGLMATTANAGTCGVEADSGLLSPLDPAKGPRSSEELQQGSDAVRSPSALEEGATGEPGMEVDVGTQASAAVGPRYEVSVLGSSDVPQHVLEKSDAQTSKICLEDNAETMEISEIDVPLGVKEGPPSTSDELGPGDMEICNPRGDDMGDEILERLVQKSENFRLYQMEVLLAHFRSAESRTSSIMASLTSVEGTMLSE